MTAPLTAEEQQRKAEFDRIFESLPGSNIDRIRAVTATLLVRENTVRGWRLARPHRVPSERMMGLLRRAVAA